MLYHLLYPLRDSSIFFNLFGYVSFRGVCAAVSAFVLAMIVGPVVIRRLWERRVLERTARGDSVKLDELMARKEGTPTLGGIIIIVPFLLATVLWASMYNYFVLLAMFTAVWLGLLGFVDDLLKFLGGRKGLSGKAKLIFQLGLGLLLGIFLYRYVGKLDNGTALTFPFFKRLTVQLGVGYIGLVVLIIAGTSNAVNLTDGLDGLAIGLTAMASAAFAVITFLVGHKACAQYLLVLHVPECSELCVACSALLGACLGFLWFNAPPAAIFMGDTGSLPLGGVLGFVAVAAKQEFMLLFVGGIFVVEALSVVLQVGVFKASRGKVGFYEAANGRRVFRCAPLHHHFQFAGWPETKIVIRFWIASALLTLLSLLTLKLR